MRRNLWLGGGIRAFQTYAREDNIVSFDPIAVFLFDHIVEIRQIPDDHIINITACLAFKMIMGLRVPVISFQPVRQRYFSYDSVIR